MKGGIFVMCTTPTVKDVRMALPAKTGDEGFEFLEKFEKQYGDGKRDAERDRRWLELKKMDGAR